MTLDGAAGGTSRVEWIARAVVVVASGWFFFTAAWGLFGIPGGGHLGSGSTGVLMAAEQMIRWKTPYAAWNWYTGLPPTHEAYICHHPFGTFYWTLPFLWLFGHRDFVVHLPTVVLSAAIPPLLYGIGRERWGSAIGAVAAAAYVVVPIAVGYSSFTNLETICIFGTLLCFWGHSRHMTTGRQRYLIASLAGLLFACSGDWVGYLLVAPLLAWGFVRAFVLPARLTPRFHFARYARWWALSVGVAVATLALWLGMYWKADQIEVWLSSGGSRGGGHGIPLEAVLRSRKNWIDFSFTPLAIFLGKAAVPVCVLRFLVLRRDEEVYALSFLFGAAIQYIAFYNGAEVHIFWPHYFAAYYALALAQLVSTIAAMAGWVGRELAPGKAGSVAGATALVVGLAPSLAMAHDGVLSLWVWRRTGGRYDDKGHLIRSEVEMLTVLKQVVVPTTERGSRIAVYNATGWGWEHTWQFQGPEDAVGLPSAADASVHRFWIARGSSLSSDIQKRVAASAHVRIYGDEWLVDQREPFAPVDAYSLNEREPNPLEWLLVSGTEPMRSAGQSPDPWLTWEWRTHLGQSAAPPGKEPTTIDEMRIAHNLAVSLGDEAKADRLRREIEAGLDRTVEARFEQGVALIGVRLAGGVEPRIETWFEAAAPVGDLVFDVRSTVEARAPLSLLPPDTTDRPMAFPPTLPTKLWRPRFIYKADIVMNHRIGRERYWGQWASLGASPAPRRLDGRPETTLAIVRQ